MKVEVLLWNKKKEFEGEHGGEDETFDKGMRSFVKSNSDRLSS